MVPDFYKQTVTELKVTPAFRHVKVDTTEYIFTYEPGHDTYQSQIYAACERVLGYEAAEEYDGRWPLPTLYQCKAFLAAFLPGDEHGLVAIVSRYEKNHKEGLEKRKKDQALLMEDMAFLFPKESQAVIFDNGVKLAGIVYSVTKQKSMFSGTKLVVVLDIIHGLNGLPSAGRITVNLPGWRAGLPLSELPISSPSAEDMAELTERGKKVIKMMTPGTYCQHTGELTQPSWFSNKYFRADGRFISDAVSFAKMDPKTWEHIGYTCKIAYEKQQANSCALDPALLDPDAWRTYPYIYGFSMPIKTWGYVKAENLRPIEWNEKAYDLLVLPPDQKELVYNLVKFHGHGMTDFIEGKGGGCIFLLHGFPGEGKTATAEAIAEVLKRPLYAVSTGELGVSPEELETNVRQLLDVAKIWNAVILLDEADIFLEARDQKDIFRNAMVGVFLRLLEYHDGVLFLTTNRVQDIDKAFYSRISVAIRYPKADSAKREKVWRQLLGLAKLSQEWAAELDEFPLNGRQIKNCIRMAQTLAYGNARAVTLDDIKRTAGFAAKFENEMSTSSKEKTCVEDAELELAS